MEIGLNINFELNYSECYRVADNILRERENLNWTITLKIEDDGTQS